MSKKIVILVEDDLNKMEDMLLSIQSILFVAVKEKLTNAPKKKDTEICLIHVLDKGEKEDLKSFEDYKQTLENRQRELIADERECEIKYSYRAVHIDKDGYPPKDMDTSEANRIICEAIDKIRQKKEYCILLDLILVKKGDKDMNEVLSGGKILSQALYQKYKENCIPYTTYDTPSHTFRKKWPELVGSEVPMERAALDGNVIHRKFKQKIYEQLKIDA